MPVLRMCTFYRLCFVSLFCTYVLFVVQFFGQTPPREVLVSYPTSSITPSTTPSITLSTTRGTTPRGVRPEKMSHVHQPVASNFPLDFWKENENKPLYYKNKTCAHFPNILELQYNNIHWQTVNTSNGTFHLLSAFFDNRTRNALKTAVRILGIIDRVEPTVKVMCQLWFNGRSEPVFAEVLEYKYIWHVSWGGGQQGKAQPYLMSCKVPPEMEGSVPAVVSIVEKPCDQATNALTVHYTVVDEKKDFVVCVKGLDFLHKDLSVRLVEWIELLGILGADKVVMYELQAHPNITKILRYYETTGQIQVVPITLPGTKPNAPYLQHLYLTKNMAEKRKHEVIPYNDCFYRNMNRYRYVVLLDIDEVIVPVNVTSWRDVIDRIVDPASPRATYAARNVYFLDDLLHSHGWFQDIPRHLHMLQHVYRTKNYTKPGHFVKAFHSTEQVLTLHNHYPRACLGDCTSSSIPLDVAHLQHYRTDCVSELKKVCDNYRRDVLLDNSIWKYKDELIRRTGMVYNKLRIDVEGI